MGNFKERIDLAGLNKIAEGLKDKSKDKKEQFKERDMKIGAIMIINKKGISEGLEGMINSINFDSGKIGVLIDTTSRGDLKDFPVINFDIDDLEVIKPVE